MSVHRRLVPVVVAVAMVALPLVSAAQSTLAAAEATAFLGAWTIGLETPQGAMSMELTLKDEVGKVEGAISAAPVMPDAQKITDIAKEGAGLALKFMLDVQGMQIPTKILLTPDGDKWKASFDLADGQFAMDGTATKK